MRFLLALFLVLTAAAPAYAQKKPDKYDSYVDPTPGIMVDYIFDSGIVKIEQDAEVTEYMLMKDCTLYDLVKDDMFKQQQMAAQISQGQAERAKKLDRNLRIKVPGRLTITRYNFNSQSFDLTDDSRMSKVSMMDVLDLKRLPCNADRSMALKRFPGVYAVKLNFPISLLRMPLAPGAAEGLFDKLESDPNMPQFKSLYTTVYISIEGIMPKIEDYTTYKKRATLLGQVDAIDVYTDIYRTKRLKRLDYSATY